MTYYKLKSGDTIGIIGGGQLGKMMAQSAQRMGFKVAVLDPDKKCPTQYVANTFINASYNDEKALKNLGDISDVITYEFENIDAQLLKKLTSQYNIPQQSEAIALLQNRLSEKETLQKAQINIVPFKKVNNEAELNEAIDYLGYPFILKTRFGGYDGKGQLVIHSENNLDEAKVIIANTPCVAEKYLKLNKEISVTATKDVYGNIVYFPLQENEHREQILFKTVVPARTDLEIKARAEVEKLVKAIHFVGTFTVEFFIDNKNELYVNEIAPRPHNSGHYSIEACDYSQFDTHIMAIAGHHLPKEIVLLKPAIMMNLLGKDLDLLSHTFYKHPEWHVHIYGKEVNKPNRKMGHLTKLSNNINQDEINFVKLFEERT